MRIALLLGCTIVFSLTLVVTSRVFADELPFAHKAEIYRDKSGEVIVFRLLLEQPFLAEEFEKSNYLRLRAADDNAYLIYPKETKFEQKHAEFFGRLRGDGTAALKLAYETVSENLDGSRRVQTRVGELSINIPAALDRDQGPPSIFLEWARRQNEHFVKLLRYYPEETFYQYALLQSRARYGVAPPPIPKTAATSQKVETGLYEAFSGSLAMQESLQRETLSTTGRIGDLTQHISTVSPPRLRSLDYGALLEAQQEAGKEPQLHDIARLVPADQYFLHFNSLKSLGELIDFSDFWGGNLQELFHVRAQDNRVEQKLENQLCLRRQGLSELFADQVIGEIAITGGDPYLLEGTDLSVLLRVENPQLFRQAAMGWLEQVKQKHPGVVSRDFNYRGQKVNAHYTEDRLVSSFVVEKDEYVIYSNSHRGVRRIIDTIAGLSDSLHAASDYRYVTTMLNPSDQNDSGYLFVSEQAIKRLVAPAAKISQKRRRQCFNNLVMLNNASLFYRLEYGRSPETLSELIDKRFVDAGKIVCPHGGAYTWDVARDTCTCSLHNRIKYLTPNCELNVLRVSKAEAEEYARYQQRYAAFWGEVFDPLAIRITVAPRIKFETCVLPFANSGYYGHLRRLVAENPRPIAVGRIAPSAVASFAYVPTREQTAAFLQSVPGVRAILEADPTLTDLAWIGDRVSMHLCDAETILEIDPTQLRALNVPFVGKANVGQQASVAAGLMAIKMPVYLTLDVENREKAEQLLEHLASRMFLNRSEVADGIQTQLDAYRLPDYKKHKMYVFSLQIYAVKLRLHASLVGDQLVAATKPEILKQVIDASVNPLDAAPAEAHLLVRFNSRALHHLHDDFELYWVEKARQACHRNIISIYNLHRLYDASLDDIAKLSETKYGVRFYCREHGEYHYDEDHNQVVCSVHGNREHSKLYLDPDRQSSFKEFMSNLDEIVAYLRFQDEALIATLEIAWKIEQ